MTFKEKNILIIGATSAIAEATAKQFAQQGSRIFLMARNQERCQALQKDLTVRGAAAVFSAPLAIESYEQDFTNEINQVITQLGGLDIVLLAHGLLPEQSVCESDIKTTTHALQVNLISAIALLMPISYYFFNQAASKDTNEKKDILGTIAVISSVAGDRGRQSNYVYGTAKGALSIFLQGLRHRLFPLGVNVLTIKPGFVDTPMTAHLPKGGLLWAQPDRIAKGIVNAIERKQTKRWQLDEVYLPSFWRWIMLVIKLLPEWIFKRTKL